MIIKSFSSNINYWHVFFPALNVICATGTCNKVYVYSVYCTPLQTIPRSQNYLFLGGDFLRVMAT